MMNRHCIAFAVYSNSRATMGIMLQSSGLEEPPSGQSYNLINKQTSSFDISCCSTYLMSFLLFQFSCAHAEGTMEFGS